jgi:uncharacterized secreted protein with C-terminal beta-propeller domain
MRRPIAITVATLTSIGLLVSGCTDGGDLPLGDGPPDGPTSKGAWEGLALEPFDSCAELTSWMAAEGAPRIGAYELGGLQSWTGFERFETVGAEISAAGDASSGPDTTSPMSDVDRLSGTDHSGTNVQEAGIDEPDVVKTDGALLVAAVDGTLRIVDVSGDAPVILGSLPFEQGWNHQLLLEGTRVFVLSGGDSGMLEGDSAIAPPYPGSETTILQEVDIADPAAPTVAATQVIEGRFLTARVVDGIARVVVTSQPHQLDVVTPSGPDAVDAAAEANRQILEQADADRWVPRVMTVDGQDIDEAEPVAECEDIGHPTEFSGFGTLTVLSVDLGQPLDTTDSVSVMADGETVYASGGSLYVATAEWLDPVAIEPLVEAQNRDDWDEAQRIQADIDESYRTTIHRFDISQSGPARYVASGTVEGHLLNSYAMSERDGVLRVATTTGSQWGGGDASESFVTTLALDGQELSELGRVGDMGEGEQIYAVRFLDDVAYVVTFRQTDPLYVVDLSDPANPRVTGELGIPGYSAYLHPLGDGRLLGVGQAGTDDGSLTGAAVSLFDVSDPANPRRVDQLELGGGSSAVEWDPHAFLYWAPEQLALVPMDSYEDPASGGVGIEVDGDDLRERGRLGSTADDCAPPPPVTIDDQAGATVVAYEECYSYGSQLLRIVVVGDDVLTLAPSGMGVHDLGTLTSEGFVAWS